MPGSMKQRGSSQVVCVCLREKECAEGVFSNLPSNCMLVQPEVKQLSCCGCVSHTQLTKAESLERTHRPRREEATEDLKVLLLETQETQKDPKHASSVGNKWSS